MTPEETRDVVEAATATISASMLMAASIVGALTAQGLVDPFKVAAFAEMFASAPPPSQPPAVQENVKAQLQGFAHVVRSMATKPAGAGTA
jgi:type IV secretory pathway TrbF-like protein